MSRDLFKGMKVPEGEDAEKKEYTPPEEKLVDIEIINSLLRQYTRERVRYGKSVFWKNDFELLAATLETRIKEAGDKIRPQPLIDSLTAMLRDESDGKHFPRTYYLTAVIQALYNLNYASEFVIDVRDWPGNEDWSENELYVGVYLRGKEDKPLTLNMHGNLGECGYGAQHCSFNLFNEVVECGNLAEFCNFTFYDYVEWGFPSAENCTFNLMPGAEIESYQALSSNGNTLRRLNEKGEVVSILNEKGEWEILGPTWLRWYHRIKTMFR